MKRILVVDDSTTILKHVEGILGEDYRLSLVKSGQLALAYLQENPVDMVLLDIFMPEMDGFETFEKIKALKKNWDVPVVFFTSGVDAEMEVHACDAGKLNELYAEKQKAEEELMALMERWEELAAEAGE